MCTLSQDQLQVIAESVYNELTFKSLARKKFKRHKEKVKSKIQDFLKIQRINFKQTSKKQIQKIFKKLKSKLIKNEWFFYLTSR